MSDAPTRNAKERLVDRATARLNLLPSPGFRVDSFQRANGIVPESIRNHQHQKRRGSNVEALEIESRDIDPPSETPIYLQVVHALIQDIRRGRLLPGTITRAMADALAVCRIATKPRWRVKLFLPPARNEVVVRHDGRLIDGKDRAGQVEPALGAFHEFEIARDLARHYQRHGLADIDVEQHVEPCFSDGARLPIGLRALTGVSGAISPA